MPNEPYRIRKIHQNLELDTLNYIVRNIPPITSGIRSENEDKYKKI